MTAYHDHLRSRTGCPICSLHDFDAHHRDRSGSDGEVLWPTCPRCAHLCVEFHDTHGIGHMVPPSMRQRVNDYRAAA